ncbi:hypothetical protein JZ751_018404 [Albula glossodonta]|uniref:Uncharacterized protein n=1 Tax=Albula glossodonta TaxID=121402 RepID=A0A8T2MWX4_9TELE|nr:hypothetical protein JZ751_018404 [Albula glossodonta]
MHFWFWLNGKILPLENEYNECGRRGAVESGGGQQWVSLPQTEKLNFICIKCGGLQLLYVKNISTATGLRLLYVKNISTATGLQLLYVKNISTATGLRLLYVKNISTATGLRLLYGFSLLALMENILEQMELLVSLETTLVVGTFLNR